MKKRKKHDNKVLLAKAKVNIVEVLFSKALIDSCIDHDKFVSMNNVLREYNEIKEEIKNLEKAVEMLIKNNGNVRCKKNTTEKGSTVRRIKRNRLMLVPNCAIWSMKK